jgi:hypothetical protein
VNAKITKALVRNVLENPSHYEWEVQGLGMLRTYLANNVRLHIWNDWLRIKNVTPIHNHAWDLESTIVAGSIVNIIYFIMPSPGAVIYKRRTIDTNKGIVLAEDTCGLREVSREYYTEGQQYNQQWYEIHQSIPSDGTVTIIERKNPRNQKTADVFGPAHLPFVSAAPREAHSAEITVVTQHALTRWFQEKDNEM